MSSDSLHAGQERISGDSQRNGGTLLWLNDQMHSNYFLTKAEGAQV